MHHSNHTESSPEQEDACLDAFVLNDSPDQGVVHFPGEAKRLNLYYKNLVCWINPIHLFYRKKSKLKWIPFEFININATEVFWQ